MANIYRVVPITQETPGTQVKATDVYAAVDTTDHTQAPSGTTKKYTIGALQGSFQTPIFGGDITSGPQAMSTNTCYTANGETLVQFSLPSTSNEGDTLQLIGKGVGGWSIVYGANQYIQWGASATTPTTGNLASANRYDNVTLRCIVPNLTWSVVGVIGTPVIT